MNLSHIAKSTYYLNRFKKRDKILNTQRYIECIIEQYTSKSKTIHEIAAKVGVGYRLIRNILIKNKVKLYNHPKNFTNKIKSDMASLYSNGLGCYAISKIFDVDASTVRKALIRNGVELRTKAEQNIITGAMRTKSFSRRYFTFQKLIRRITEINYRHNKFIINPNNHPRTKSGFVLDHIISVKSAYKIFSKSRNWKLLYLFAHPANLQLISNSENSRKQQSSWMSVFELQEAVNDWNYKHFCPYERLWDLDDMPIYAKLESEIGHFEGYANEK